MSVSRIFFVVFLIAPSFAWAQCPWDFTGDGFVDAADNDVLSMLGSFGSDNSDADFNGTGIVDVLDVLEFAQRSGRQCPNDPAPHPETDGRIVDLHLAIHHIHESEVNSDFSPIPAGSITYRLYLEVAGSHDFVQGVYGNAQNPLIWDATEPLYTHLFGSEVVGNINETILQLDPALEYTSYLCIGYDIGEAEFDHQYGYGINMQADQLFGSTHFELSSEEGSGWLSTNTFGPYYPASNLRLLAQITLPPGAELDGNLNAQIATVSQMGFNNEVLSFERAEGLTFSTSDLTAIGCTDANALNFDPAAVLDNGSCEFLGDFDDNGVVNTADILDLIASIGCPNCGAFDLNGDGVVGVEDVLIILGVFGG